jgi:integrase
VAGHAGLRRGELCGLRWTDVDNRRRVLVVRRQILDIGAGLTIGKPKTRSGEDRIVDLDRGTARMLHFLRLRQSSDLLAAGTQDTGYVFTGPDGRPWHPATVSHRFRRLTAQAGLRRCRFHDLRHLAASLQLAAGVDIAIVSKRLGHSTYTITADTYCHLLPGVGRRAAEAAAKMVPRRNHPPAA